MVFKPGSLTSRTWDTNFAVQNLCWKLSILSVASGELGFEPVAICDRFCSPTFSASEAREKIAHGVSRGVVHQERKSHGPPSFHFGAASRGDRFVQYQDCFFRPVRGLDP